ncbi:hypothetical protein ABW19_dt0201755 [Dactylella cylindrospora]|nr:hypothetical protein ABW19_dt0201755 [Dactylella cylindrospora]
MSLVVLMLNFVMFTIMVLSVVWWLFMGSGMRWTLVSLLSVATSLPDTLTVSTGASDLVDSIIQVSLPPAEHVILAHHSGSLSGSWRADVNLPNKDLSVLVLENREFEDFHGGGGPESRDGEDVKTEAGEVVLIGFDEEVEADGDVDFFAGFFGFLDDGEGFRGILRVDEWEERDTVEGDGVTGVWV